MTDKLIDSALMELNRCIRADAGLGPFDEAHAILSRLVQAVREECAQACEPPSAVQWEWFAGQVEDRFEWQWGEDACSNGLGGLQLAAALIRALASKTGASVEHGSKPDRKAE